MTNQIPSYFQRVSDYLNDPFFPEEDKRKPLVIIEALWYCLRNQWIYDDEQLAARIAEKK